MSRRSVPVLAVLLILFPASLQAQNSATSPRADGAMFAARARLAPVAPIVTLAGDSAAAPAAVAGSRRRQGVVFMLVGAAGIVTGLIVDESILTIAGAAVGGFGLYLYLDSGGKVGMQVPIR